MADLGGGAVVCIATYDSRREDTAASRVDARDEKTMEDSFGLSLKVVKEGKYQLCAALRGEKQNLRLIHERH